MLLTVRLFGILVIFLVAFPEIIDCFAQNCDKTTEGKRECLRVPGYTGFQFARCSSHSFIHNVSRGVDSCIQGQNNKHQFCWYPCQRQMHNRTDGAVSANCRCGNHVVDGEDGNTIWDYNYTQYISNSNIDPVDPDILKTLNNCSYLTDSDRICFHDKNYKQSQWITCRSSSYVYQKTRGSFRCDPERLYCWLPCQKENHGFTDGDVSNECSCDSNNSQPGVVPSKNSIVGDSNSGSITLTFSSITMIKLLLFVLLCWIKMDLFQ